MLVFLFEQNVAYEWDIREKSILRPSLAQEHSGYDDSLYLVKQIPSNRPRARFQGAPFEILKSTKLAISVRQKQTDNSTSSSSLLI